MYSNNLKGVLDPLIASILLVFLSPVLLLVTIYIKIVNSGPVFFKQKRVGLNEKIFWIYKFRTMFVGSDRIDQFSTQENDKRIYPGGKILRLLSLDELPQLFNVLKGDMSFVGPRPDVPSQKDYYTTAEWSQRCSVKPGITGLAQIMGRSSLSAKKRKHFDLRYAKDSSFILDMKIILKTLLLLLCKRKAN